MGAYSRSSTRTPSASANRRAVLGLAMRRSSSKSEMESADTLLLAESSRGDIPRELSYAFESLQQGHEWLLPGDPSGRTRIVRARRQDGAGRSGHGGELVSCVRI